MALRECLECARRFEGHEKVVLKFIIGELSCPVCALDQVQTVLECRGETIHQCPQSASNPVTNYRVTNFAVNRVGHIARSLVGVLDEDDSKRSTPSTTRWRRKLGELPSGDDPTGHEEGSDRQLVTALETTRFENGASGTGAHSSAETVSLGPLPLIWLISTLHKILFSSGVNALCVTSWRSLALY